MKDKVFLDTNVLVYAKLEDEGDKEKRDTAVALIQQIQGSPIISSPGPSGPFNPSSPSCPSW